MLVYILNCRNMNSISLTISRGAPQPYGVTTLGNLTNFAIYNESDQAPTLLIYNRQEEHPLLEVTFKPQHRTGKVWHLALENLPKDLCYAYRFGDKPASLLLDPYAKAVYTGKRWNTQSKTPYQPKGAILTPENFDWQGDAPLQLPLSEMIVYEMHVRGFTAHASSQVKSPGTYAGILEKIDFLRDLGINAIELLPVYEFNENEYRRNNPLNKQLLCNFWGYSTVNFFSPMERYAAASTPEGTIAEFKTLVRELHKNGIEVILDVVYNHTAEGNKDGPTYNFKALANNVYYTLEGDGQYSNYSGCGNTFSCNQIPSMQLIMDSLRYWVTEMHVDGFRFDLASILCRNEDGVLLGDAPLIQAISNDPILASTKLIAEPWDAVGAYQVGNFGPRQAAWSEWNGHYRDDVRKFIKGTVNKGVVATRICGSEDIYSGRACGTSSSINFITSHDGFTLADLVSYNFKHNMANGENNSDGSSFNDSWNCGEEGPSKNLKVHKLRQQQMRNFHLALMLSQGIPMLLMGDEYGHSKNGNNNTWCQDNNLNWFQWDQCAKSQFLQFYKQLIAFRRSHAAFKRSAFLTDKDIVWHSSKLNIPNWQGQNHLLAFTLKDPTGTRDLYAAFNAYYQEISIELPTTSRSGWYWVVNTGNSPPNDFMTDRAKPVTETTYILKPYTAILLQFLDH